MTAAYDTYYQTENLFGAAYPELLDYFSQFSNKGKVLDLGCGQGRDAIPLARMGFDVTGIDRSKVGIEQMNQIAETKNLSLEAIVADIFEYDKFEPYDFILLDSMFHFSKKDLIKETEFIKTIVARIKVGCLLVFCIQDSGKKVEILNRIINSEKILTSMHNEKINYIFEDKEGGHRSASDYRIIVVRKN